MKTNGDETVTQDAEERIRASTGAGDKNYDFNQGHDPRKPLEYWFQRTYEGDVLFAVFYTQACRWSRCTGCSLPSRMSISHVPFSAIMDQIDFLFNTEDVRLKFPGLRKIILSNNGSVLDEATFSSTALMYFIAKMKKFAPAVKVLSIETRPEYVDWAELEFIARALREGDEPVNLEIAVGFEMFDDVLRNEVFKKGLSKEAFLELAHKTARFGFALKCYFMLKPVSGISADDAVKDIHAAIDFLHSVSIDHHIEINMHLNPTYAAKGTTLEQLFLKGLYSPPEMLDLARAALYAKGKKVSLFLGLSDEGLACPGGSFLRPGDEAITARLEEFNASRDYTILEEIVSHGA